MARKRSRTILTVGAIAILGAALTFAFWPRPPRVDLGEVTRGPMMMTIDEEGRTRVHDTYVVSTPVAGRLLRVDVEPGDPVIEGKSVIAGMLPINPSVLDIRGRAEARAEIAAAEAALLSARAELDKAVADRELAQSELQRTRRLREDAMVSQVALERAVREARAAEAQLGAAQAAIAMREAELANARARLINYRDEARAGTRRAKTRGEIPIYSPATGRVLRVMQQSETILPAGAPILEIGNIDHDLEVWVELLSTDAVRVSPGDRVLIENWGGPETLNGVVDHVEPLGFTKVSALGVEEQRVNTIIRFTDPKQGQKGLGHGFRVEARIVVWEDENALIVPSSALFRDGQDWAVFVVAVGIAKLRRVEIGRDNGIQAQILGGLEMGDRVILYPSSGLSEGTRVAQRKIN